MSWYTIIDYKISIHPTKDTIVYLHIGQIEYKHYSGRNALSGMFEVWIKDIKQKMPGHVWQSDIDDKPAEKSYVEQVQLNFADASKAALLIDQLEKAFQSGVLPSYNKDGDWISIQTSRVSYKIPLDTPLPK